MKARGNLKVLLINGSPHENGCVGRALTEIERTLHEEDVETWRHWIGTKPVAGCIACGKCAVTGVCVFQDAVNELNAKAHEFDAMIVGSPVYYAGPTGQIHCLLDRLFYSSHGKWSGKLGATVVSCRRGGATAAFDCLNKYFTISSMPVVSSQYWNQVHGSSPADVEQDREGLQTMRVMARNLAYLLRCREAAEAAGVPEPEQEQQREWTNFIH